MNITAVEHKFNLGDIVCSILDSEYTYVINNINIHSIKNNSALTISYDCADQMGELKIFREYELKLVSEINITKS